MGLGVEGLGSLGFGVWSRGFRAQRNGFVCFVSAAPATATATTNESNRMTMNNNGNMYMRTVSATNTKVMVIAKVPVLLVLES